MNLCLIRGDGIGGEVMAAAQRLLRALVPALTFTEANAGWATFQQQGTALPDDTLAAARSADAVFFGAVASPSHPVEGYRSPIVALRRALDLYANIRPVRSAGLSARAGLPAVDLVVVRENTEGLYAGRERLEDDGATAIAERVITRRGTERIVRAAMDLALARAQQRSSTGSERAPLVTLVHKANVLRVSDGLFRSVALEVARDYPEVELDELLVDTAAMHLARSPERFDVLVTSNLFGDILSDVSCIHGGGLGLASSANLGDTHALFEPVHGAAPDIAGQGIANPLAAFGCVAMWLEWAATHAGARAHANAAQHAQQVRAAIEATLRDGPHTPDLGGNATTTDITDAVLNRL